MSSPNIVYFDLETQRSAEEVGGWDRIRDMGMSVGVTYSTHRGGYKIYGEDGAIDLVEELFRADLVVGFNHLRFDYEVLQGYDFRDLRQAPSLDLMLELQKSLQHRLSLESVASASLGAGKIADGLKALEWFREGRMMEIAEYCCFDVKVTKMVHEYGMKYGAVWYKNRFGKALSVPVDWSDQPVQYE